MAPKQSKLAKEPKEPKAKAKGTAKLSGDHTLGGSDGHFLSGVVEKCALADGIIA